MKLIDLTYLKKVSNNDQDMMIEMLEIFKEQCKEFIAEFEQHIANNNNEKLSLLAHKVKSSVAIMGMNDFAIELKEFEKLAKENKGTETYKEKLDIFISTFNIALKEIDEIKINLKS